MNKRAVGDVRPSQVITTFGPGAIVDLIDLSVIVAGIDSWHTDESTSIQEPRLARKLGVDEFHAAKPSEGRFGKQGTVPVYIFPRYQVCPVCKTLAKLCDGNAVYDAKYKNIKCHAPGCKGKGKDKYKYKAVTSPAPFIVACPGGHLDEFPWRTYLHEGETNCNGRMYLRSKGWTSGVEDIVLSCTCKMKRNLARAFDRDTTALGACNGRRPWLGPDDQEEGCQHHVRALRRGASNAWFPLVSSALSILDDAKPLAVLLGDFRNRKIELVTTEADLRQNMRFLEFDGYSAAEVWQALERKRNGQEDVDPSDLRRDEWKVLCQPGKSASETNEFFLERAKVPDSFKGYLAQVVKVRKLLEVRALRGFTRIDPSGGGFEDDFLGHAAPIYRTKPNWLPAVKVRGEGIFLELSMDRVAHWEQQDQVQKRGREMARVYIDWQTERKITQFPFFPGPRYVLLHTLAHALIRQVSLDCGYSASSIRERIYSDSGAVPMAGILLYTASADSEGSLGGLVDLANPTRFPELFEGALRSMELCSSDPLCADHHPNAHGTVNGAACHACALAAETSCESFNFFLDRNLLVPTLAHTDLAYFQF